MLKKSGAYFLFAVVGLLLGYFIFGVTSEKENTSIEIVTQVNGKWTCSMHPQIGGTENGKCPLCAMDLVFTSDANGNLPNYQFRMSNDAIALANIQTIKVRNESPNNNTLKLSGVITTNKEKDAVQTTLFDGRIDKLYQNSIGKRIRKGQEIGLIYSPELYAAQDKLLTSISYRDTHKKLFNSARNTLGLWKLNDKQIEEIVERGKPIMNFPLFADVTGTITEMIAAEGGYYSQGDPLFKTSDLRTVWGEFDAYESQLSFLKIGQEIDIQLTNMPNEKINAKITYIEPLLNKEKRTVLVRVLIKNHKRTLKPGMFAEAFVNQVNLGKELPIIPKSAVLWTGKRSVVYKKPFSDKSIFEMVEVELGQRLGDFYQIQSGVRAGDIIVNEGAFTVDAAAQLKGKKSMMSNKVFDEKTHHHDHDNMKMELKDVPKRIDISAEFEDEIHLILQDYMNLKEVLVLGDGDEARLSSVSFLKNLEKLEFNSSFESVDINFTQISKSLVSIKAENNIENQRKEFKFLSDSMINLISSFENFQKPIYIQHCDCVDNFNGASWLSFNEKVINPYFGEAMLNCGRVESVLN